MSLVVVRNGEYIRNNYYIDFNKKWVATSGEKEFKKEEEQVVIKKEFKGELFTIDGISEQDNVSGKRVLTKKVPTVDEKKVSSDESKVREEKEVKSQEKELPKADVKSDDATKNRKPIKYIFRRGRGQSPFFILFPAIFPAYFILFFLFPAYFIIIPEVYT